MTNRKKYKEKRDAYDMMMTIKGVTWKCVPYMPEPPKGE